MDVKARKGFFVSFEGNDGCGKTTQILLLEKGLKHCGRPVVRTREPGGCPVSEKIRELLLDRNSAGMQDMTEALLYAASRAQHVREVIRPALEAGAVVLCDRFVDSSIAYQGAGRGIGMETVEAINAPAVDGCMPDLSIFLDIDYRLAIRRRNDASAADRIEMLDDGFRRRVQEAYHSLLKRDPGRFVLIDASAGPEDIARSVFACVSVRLREAGIA